MITSMMRMMSPRHLGCMSFLDLEVSSPDSENATPRKDLNRHFESQCSEPKGIATEMPAELQAMLDDDSDSENVSSDDGTTLDLATGLPRRREPLEED